jgi:hypothetical protein
MKRIVFALVAVAALGGAAAYMVPASGQADGEAAPIYGIKIPAEYRDWRLISVNHLAGGNVKQVRAQLGQRHCDKGFPGRKAPFSHRRRPAGSAVLRAVRGAWLPLVAQCTPQLFGGSLLKSYRGVGGARRGSPMGSPSDRPAVPAVAGALRGQPTARPAS